MSDYCMFSKEITCTVNVWIVYVAYKYKDIGGTHHVQYVVLTSFCALSSKQIFSIACAVLSTTLACLIKCRYNHVLVFHRRIHTTLVSNTWWMLFMLSIALESAVGSARIILGMPRKTADESLFYTQMLLHGISATVLCVAIDYQHRYRSSHDAMLAPKAIALHANSDR